VGAFVVGDGVVVLQGRNVARSIDVASHERTASSLVKRALAPGEHAGVLDQVLDR
jgi:hypothetical protein